jgi:hypothetical protein
VSVYEWPAVIVTVACDQTPVLVHVFASAVWVVPEVLSVSVAVAQSYVSVSGQTLRYQNDRLVVPVGAVNVWAIELSPLVGLVRPTIAAYVPECGVAVVAEALPDVIHPFRVPVSNVPFWKALVTGALIATSSK